MMEASQVWAQRPIEIRTPVHGGERWEQECGLREMAIWQPTQLHSHANCEICPLGVFPAGGGSTLHPGSQGSPL